MPTNRIIGTQECECVEARHLKFIEGQNREEEEARDLSRRNALKHRSIKPWRCWSAETKGRKNTKAKSSEGARAWRRGCTEERRRKTGNAQRSTGERARLCVGAKMVRKILPWVWRSGGAPPWARRAARAQSVWNMIALPSRGARLRRCEAADNWRRRGVEVRRHESVEIQNAWKSGSKKAKNCGDKGARKV